MATLANLRTYVSSVIGLDTTAAAAEEALLDARINQGVLDFLLRTRCNVNPGTVTTIAGVGDYLLGSAVLAIQDVSYQSASASTTSALERVSPARILELRRTGATQTVARLYALNGHDLLMIYPTPSGADTITFYYVPRPTKLSSGAHDPSAEAYGGIPEEYHPALEAYATWWMADYSDDQSSQIGRSYRDLYRELVAQFKRNARGKGGRSLGRVAVGRSSVVPADRAVDWP